MKQKDLRTFYLLTLPPLFLLSLVILFFDPDFLDSALFAFGYSFTLVVWTPYIEELVHTKKYKLSFLRLCFVITKKALNVTRATNKPYYASLVRIALPGIFMLLIMGLLQTTLSFYYSFLGAFMAEALLHLLRRYLPKELFSGFKF